MKALEHVNYFSVIDQSNYINCLLHLNPYFTFETLIITFKISYWNVISKLVNFWGPGFVLKLSHSFDIASKRK